MDNYEAVELDNLGKSIIGKMVVHPRFGTGKVLEFEDTKNPTITVQFEDKTRLLSFDGRTRALLNLITENEKKRNNQTIKKSGQLYLADWEEEDMAESLLAHLYTRISGSQEDVATVSLKYIIDSSPALNAAYNKLLSDALKIEIPSDVRYKDQSVGENMERPDMSGTDSAGNEIVLCEMKFYAGLTENQPNGYLKRLIDEGGKALVFVCPKARRVSLWSKVKDLCLANKRVIADEDGYRVTVDGIAMAIITWTEIIDTLRLAASSVAVTALPDIAQLSGFCNMMDQDAFIPLASDELGPETPRRENRYYHIVDAVIDRLLTMQELEPSIKGVRATAVWDRYERAIKIRGYWITVKYDRTFWSKSAAEAPFWLRLSDSDWKQTETIKQFYDSVEPSEIHSNGSITFIALHPLTDVPLDDIAEDMVKKIIKYIMTIEEYHD